jgi:uncharacterized protein (TIGR03083 family)
MSDMECSRLLAHLENDFALLRTAVAAADARAPIPTCPEWTVADLARHVAEVYLHKVECIRLGRIPDQWPPDSSTSDPATALDEAHAELLAQFGAHEASDHAATWYEPDQTVGFWIRRMAQETVIHRVDAELAAQRPLAPIADDLSVDGIDEMLTRFLSYGSVRWQDEFGSLLDAPDERPISVITDVGSWQIVATAAGVLVTSQREAADGSAAWVRGAPDALLLWLWNRAGDDAVTSGGDRALLDQFYALRTEATQ